MDYSCGEKRKTKKDLKKKKLNRGYRRGGKFRTANVSQDNSASSDKK